MTESGRARDNPSPNPSRMSRGGVGVSGGPLEQGAVMKIRFLVKTVSSRPSRNGWTDHYAVITSTATGRTLTVKNAVSAGNVANLVRKACGGAWGDAGLYRTEEEDVPIREFNSRHKAQGEYGAVFEHEVKAAMILDLEHDERIRCRCGGRWARCPGCNSRHEHGTRSHCQQSACLEMNAPLDCVKCGKVVSADHDGVIDHDGELIPYVRA